MLYDAEAGNITMALTGDSLITRPMSPFTEEPFLGLVELLRKADVSVTNAEMLFHRFENSPSVIGGGSYMGADPSILGELKWMGIDMVATANNHAYDFGQDGVLTNLANLAESGLVSAGTGRTMAEAREPHYFESRNGRVALISATSSGPPGLYAGDRWRDGPGRPGANFVRYTTSYTVNKDAFEALRRFRDEFRLGLGFRGTERGYADLSWGLSQIPDSDDEFFMGDLHNMWQYPIPAGYRFKLGDEFTYDLVPVEKDIEENIERISDAKRMADWVIVSFHNHEAGRSPNDPSAVTTTFAHAAIDAGADVFHGHGPHHDRGIEIYKGKPIFYSIGHLVQQNDMVGRVPLDNILRQGLDPAHATPADFYDSRSGRELEGEWLGWGTHPAGWRDAVVVVEFEHKELSAITLHPIDLGFQRARGQRGRPVLASGENADAVIELFSELSATYGTKIIQRDGLGHVDVGGALG